MNTTTFSIHRKQASPYGRRELLTGAALLLLASACGAAQTSGASAAQGDFALRDMTGRTVRLSDYLGKNVVLLNFWASWCAPCAAELPQLDRIYKAHRSAGLMILGIVMDGPETMANVAPIVRRYDLSFPVLLDEETRVVGIYNPKRAAPYSVLFGKDSAIVKSREGYVAGDERALEADILAQLHKPS